MSMDNSGALTGEVVDPVKPGIQTSEFWVAVGTGVSTLVVAVLALFGHHVKSDDLKPIIGAVAILGPIVASAYYSQSRGVVKAAAHAAQAGVVAAQLYQPQMLEASPLLSAPPEVHVHLPTINNSAGDMLVEASAVPPAETPADASADVETDPVEAAPPAEPAVEAPATIEVPPDVPTVPMAEETGAGN